MLCLAHFLKRRLQPINQGATAVAIDGADLETVVFRRFVVIILQEVGDASFAVLFGNEIQLVEHQPARLGRQFRAVLFKFAHNGPGVMRRIGRRVGGREIDDVQQDAGACQMLEKADTEPGPLGGAFDQPRNIGDDKALVLVDAHHAEIRVHRRERIIGDLGTRRRYRANQGAFPGIG